MTHSANAASAAPKGLGGDEAGDVTDIAFLVQRPRLKTPQTVLEVVGRYYPDSQVPVRAQFLLEEVFAD